MGPTHVTCKLGRGVVAEPAISHSSLGWCLLQADTVQLGVAISSQLFKATGVPGVPAGGVQGEESSGQSPEVIVPGRFPSCSL